MGGIINSRDNQHTAIDLIVNLLPQKLNYGYRMMINTISAFFCLAFAGAGVMWVQKANSQVSSILRIPMHYLYLVTVICGAFMALNIFSNMVNEHRKQKSQKGDKVHEF
jgi:TRAP-type C4-dicarboxylate transport system permease small subunit